MLVINRKLNEKLQIGDDIIVHVVNIHNENIFLNLTLPSGELKCEVINENEKIQVTDEIVIRATVIKGKRQVRVGISAPVSMKIKRL